MEGLNSNKNLTEKKEKIVDMNASGFNLSDEEYRRELIEILKRLINYPTFLISGKELHQKNTDDILQKIATFSDAILINAKQNTVVIKNRLKLKSILKEVQKIIKELNKKGIKSYLAKNNKLVWRCSGCSHFWIKNAKQGIGDEDNEVTSPKIMLQLLNRFSDKKYKVCPKCCERNYFFILENGTIEFYHFKKGKNP